MNNSMKSHFRDRKLLALVSLVGLAAACKQGEGPIGANGAAKVAGDPPLTVSAAAAADTYNADFGQVAVGQHLDATLELSNDGSSPLTIVTVSAPTDPEFSITLAPSTTVQAGGKLPVTVSFKPFSAGQKTASVTLQTDSTSTPTVTVNFTGTGVNLKLVVSPKSLDFGTVVVHTQKPLQITLTNQSTLDLTVTPSSMQGNDAALFTSDTNNPFSLSANGTQTITVTFAPLAQSQNNEDVASFVLSTSAGDNVTVNLQGIAAEAGLQITPDPLDFSFVPTGTSLTKTLKIVNIGNRIINISSASVTNPGNPQSAFSAVPVTGMLTPGQELDIPVTFEPAVQGQFTGELDVISNDNNSQVDVPLEGWGGGAAIDCEPPVIDFSTVGAGFITTAAVICTNTGTDVKNPDGTTNPGAELIFDPKSPLRLSNAAFSAAFNPPAANVSLTAGQSVRIDVGYDPAGTEQDTGTLTIVTNYTNPPAPPVIALSGNGIKEAKCYYTLTPSTLNWGEVTPKLTFINAFTITNIGPNECLVSGLDLTVDTQTAFTLPNGPILSQRLSPPGVNGAFPTSLSVPVRFNPQQEGGYSGAVAFTITDPDAPNQTVNLSGFGGSSCLVIKPNPLDFPLVGLSNGQYCQNSKLKFNIVNSCTQTATVTSLSLVSGNSSFDIIDAPAVPFTVAANGNTPPILVGFKPTAAGTFYGSIQVTADIVSQPLMEFMEGKAEAGSSQTDEFTEHRPSADILWIVDTDDDFGFYSGTGTNFFPELQDFMAAASGVDYQMGVTTVEVCAQGDKGNIEPCSNCHNKSYNGSSDALILTPDLADPGQELQALLNNINVDPCDPCQDCNSCCAPGADDEHFLAAGQLALDPNSPAAPHNQGFLRPDAFLSLILVNGDVEDDYSPDTWQSYVQFFQNLKADPSLFNVNYIISDPDAFVSAYPNLTAMVKQTGGVLVDSVNDKWAAEMAALWQTVLASSTVFPLSGSADPTTLQLFVDGPPPDQVMAGQAPGIPLKQFNPNGTTNWTYNPISNTVVINASTVPLNNGDTLYVEYTLVCD